MTDEGNWVLFGLEVIDQFLRVPRQRYSYGLLERDRWEMSL